MICHYDHQLAAIRTMSWPKIRLEKGTLIRNLLNDCGIETISWPQLRKLDASTGRDYKTTWYRTNKGIEYCFDLCHRCTCERAHTYNKKGDQTIRGTGPLVFGQPPEAVAGRRGLFVTPKEFLCAAELPRVFGGRRASQLCPVWK